MAGFVVCCHVNWGRTAVWTCCWGGDRPQPSVQGGAGSDVIDVFGSYILFLHCFILYENLSLKITQTTKAGAFIVAGVS